MTASAARNGLITRFAPARRSDRTFWGQVLGTESAAALPREATRIALKPEARLVARGGAPRAASCSDRRPAIRLDTNEHAGVGRDDESEGYW
jgi:hypothetical protein